MGEDRDRYLEDKLVGFVELNSCRIKVQNCGYDAKRWSFVFLHVFI